MYLNIDDIDKFSVKQATPGVGSSSPENVS